MYLKQLTFNRFGGAQIRVTSVSLLKLWLVGVFKMVTKRMLKMLKR